MTEEFEYEDEEDFEDEVEVIVDHIKLVKNASVEKWKLSKLRHSDDVRYLGDLTGLKKSLQYDSQINAMIIDETGQIICGDRRLASMIELGWEDAEVKVVHNLPKRVRIKLKYGENAYRKANTEIEKAKVVFDLDSDMRKLHGEKPKGGRPKKNTGTVPVFWTNDKTADEFYDQSERSVRRIKIVIPIVREHTEYDDFMTKFWSKKAILELSKLGEIDDRKEIKKEIKERWDLKDSIDDEDQINRGIVKTNIMEYKERKRLQLQIAALAAQTITPNIKHCDYKDHLKTMQDKSVDLLITDPLYMSDVPDIKAYVEEWVDIVLKKLSDSGQAYIFTGAYYEEIAAYMEQLEKGDGKRFTKQLLVWEYRNTIGPMTKTKYKQNWQAIFYLRGSKAPEINTDQLVELFAVQRFNAPDARHGLKFHTWEKPLDLIKQLIRHGSKIGDLVFDPFTGTGTMLLAAAELGRKNIGTEIDEKMIEIALERGCVLK